MSAEKPGLSDPRSFAFLLVGTPLLVLISLVTKSWATGRGDSITVGLLGPSCSGCDAATLDRVGGGGALGVLALLGGILVMAAAGLFGGLVLAHKQDKLPPYVAGHAAFGGAALFMLIYAFRIGGADEVSLSWSPLFGLGGVGVGWYLLWRLSKVAPKQSPYATTFGATTAAAPAGGLGGMFESEGFGAADPSKGSPISTAQPQPSTQPIAQPAASQPATASAAPANQPTKCPKCKGAVEYIPQYQRSWCARCYQYA